MPKAPQDNLRGFGLYGYVTIYPLLQRRDARTPIAWPVLAAAASLRYQRRI
ncbi:hypothetical protein [Taibaiella koreensis]|uniref:hypothetical protein n=1 Tax=Taibaiella koreensis TaxID=1268548 RepID=UPI0013C31FD6|nr:hypothetical protein [Taibaiella koreensis]